MKTGGYVYRFKSDIGEILYVGKTTDLKKRVEQHLKTNTLPVSFKELASKVEYIKFYSDPDLHIAENYYINKYKPEYNILNKLDGKLTIKLAHQPEWKEYKNENLRPTVKNKTVGSALREVEGRLYSLESDKERYLKRALKAEEELKRVEDMYVHVMRKILNIDEQKVNKIIELNQLEIK